MYSLLCEFYFYVVYQEDDDLVNRTEGSVIDAFLCLVVKLSEASFRPMFLRVRLDFVQFHCAFHYLANSAHATVVFSLLSIILA